MPDHRAPAEPDVIGLDWGTSSCRAYLLGDQGVILGDARGPTGLMPVRAGRTGDPTEFDQAFQELCGSWLDAWPELPVIACGMVAPGGAGSKRRTGRFPLTWRTPPWPALGCAAGAESR